MKSSIPLALLATVTLFTACQTPENPGAVRFRKADVNHDDRLSRAECSDYFIGKVFEGLDKNHDEKLSWEEWKVEGVKGARARFAARDTDKDGFVTLAEALANGRKLDNFDKVFAEADKDKDHALTLPEVQAFYASKEGPVR